MARNLQEAVELEAAYQIFFKRYNTRNGDRLMVLPRDSWIIQGTIEGLAQEFSRVVNATIEERKA